MGAAIRRIYSGKEYTHEYGVAILMMKEIANSMIEWKPVNDRIIVARFNSKHINLTIVQAYAPTNDAKHDIKQEFYNTMHDVVQNIPKHDVTLVMGDFNAKVGKDNAGYEKIMGNESPGKQSENGMIFIEFCDANDLVIGGSVFPHKEAHKLTWTSPKGDKNQIDHTTINRKYRRTVQDVRVRRGADISSDHELVVATLKLKLRKVRKSIHSRAIYNTEKLKDPDTRIKYNVKIESRFSELTEEEGIDDQWNSMKKIFTEVSQEVLGRKTRNG